MIFTKTKKAGILTVLSCFFVLLTAAQNTKTNPLKVTKITLDNGLTVLLNEDHSKPLVYGGVVTRAGSKNDPADHTGIAHYLEHMLFKGTEVIGTTDYNEEKQYLENIYALYDSLGKTTDEVQRKEIQKKINEQSVKASAYALPTEIDKLVKSIGGTGLNAFTAEEMTFFHNAFPPSQIDKWLDLYATRFINPVFRSFQSELEVVYEEKNRSMDNFAVKLIETFLKNLYKKHPYGQQNAIGSIEHLKNPSLNAMYQFYKTYYVANNMALVICGDFNTNEIIPVIKEKFGTWKSGTIPVYPTYKEDSFKGREVVEAKLTPIKVGVIGFRTAPNGNPDEIALDVCNRILANTGETGLLDKLVLDNKLMAAEYVPLGQNNDYGSAVFLFVPKVIGQSLENAESLIMNEFDSLRKGKFDDWLLEAVKKDIYVEFKQNLEGFDNRAVLIAQAFSQYRDIDDYLTYPEKINKITKDDIIWVANKYYNKNYLILLSKMGFPKKDKIDKPGYDPVKPKQDAKSEYAIKFDSMKAKEPVADFVDFNQDIQIADLAKGVTLYYAVNPENDIYTLMLKFGVGSAKIPQLEEAAELMNYAGTKSKSLSEIKKEFQKIGCSYSFYCDENYVTAELTGIESDLKAGVGLLQELISDPVVEKDKIKNIIDGEQTNRKLEDADAPSVAKALIQYIRKKDKSTFLNRLSMKEIKALNADSLVAVFKKALGYEVQVHYIGNQFTFDQVTELLKNTLAFQPDLKPSESPVVINDEVYNENTVFFVNRKDAVQSQIYFYVKGEDYSIDKEPDIDAFNEYFGGGFSGLVIQEIREYRSMAYSAGASYTIPLLTGKRSSFIGYVGTQADKTIDAIRVFDSLLLYMPQKKERIETIRSSLVQEAYASRPDFRDLTETFVGWKLKGYYEDPSKYKLPYYNKLTFDNIEKFYENNIKGKPVVICIVGDKKRLNMTEIAKYGKIVEVKESALYKK